MKQSLWRYNSMAAPLRRASSVSVAGQASSDQPRETSSAQCGVFRAHSLTFPGDTRGRRSSTTFASNQGRRVSVLSKPRLSRQGRLHMRHVLCACGVADDTPFPRHMGCNLTELLEPHGPTYQDLMLQPAPPVGCLVCYGPVACHATLLPWPRSLVAPRLDRRC